MFYFYSKHHYRYITRTSLHTYIIFKSNFYTWGGRDKVNANFHNNSNFEKCLSPLPFFPFHFHPILSIASFTPLLYLYISFPKGWKRIYGIEKTKVQSENEMRAQPSFHVALCVCVCAIWNIEYFVYIQKNLLHVQYTHTHRATWNDQH